MALAIKRSSSTQEPAQHPKTTASRGRDPGFFSSVRVFSLEPGSNVEPDAIRGYYIDFRAKAPDPTWPPPWLQEEKLHVRLTQWALGAYERFLCDEGEAWLAAAFAAGEHLIRVQAVGGRQDGGFVHLAPFPHTFPLEPPWLSSITQGQAASLFVRLHLEAGEERYAEAARRSLRPYAVPSSAGGVQTLLGGRPFPEEYPTSPPSFVLNGGLFALFGVYDVAMGLGDSASADEFELMSSTFASNLHRWDLGYWSRYDLYPHRLVNVASSSYHHLHASQLESLARLSSNPAFPIFCERFRAYETSSFARQRALARKVAFRAVVSRRRRPA
jgi:heparosan-N-sulfate-glucuronate 5-epimerase